MTVQFKLPELGEHVESADLIKILVSVGDRIAVDQPVLELETEKADFEVPATVSGIVKAIHVREGEKVKVGQVLLTVEEEVVNAVKTPVEEEAPVPEKTAPATPLGQAAEHLQQKSVKPLPEERAEVSAARPLVPASPTVRRLARELGVAIEQVPASGPAGRILADDVMAFAKRLITGTGGLRPAALPALPDFSRWGEIERRSMTGIRRKIAESLSYSWSSIPHVTNFESADITVLEQLRKRFAGEIEASGGKLTITSIAVKVIASALKVFPSFAASLDMEREQIIIKKYCHIGVAVDTDRGLIVPVIRDADKKNIRELSVELVQLAEKAKSKKITMEEMEGAVFTITNLGSIGGTHFAPIIHAPEVAILGISRARLEAVMVDGKFEPRLLLPLSLSYDHRLIDGADAARFLRWITQALEQPFMLPLEG
ncbi:MAG: 2-oxo acid dehydrogenase subunit E2 [Acidobacteriia bacterium]|nr:2-oxo acid dehydrogenase subunit E2 [Terriglobia bacterium]